MRRDLQHGIRGSVDNGLACTQVLASEADQNLRARGLAVAKDSGQPGAGRKRAKQLRRHGLRGRGEIAPVKRHRCAGHFKMSARRVLASADLRGAPVFGPDRPEQFQTGGHAARG